jgi:quinol monooxygenase YgiN
MLNVIAIITTKPGQRAAVLDAFRANRPTVLAEDGCIEYAAAVDIDPALPFQAAFGPDTFVVIEKWRDADALGAHARAPHMAEYGKKTRDMVASRAIHVLNTVD